MLAYPVTVIGVGPGSREYLLPAAWEAAQAVDLLVGGRNALALFASLGKEQCLIERDLDGVLAFIDVARQDRRVAVLLSGDPGFYSLLPRLRQRFGADALHVVPGVSSLQLACARLGLKWDDMTAISVHGRGLDGLTAIAGAGAGTARVAVLTEPKFPPAAVCRYLLKQGSRFRQVWVLTDLGLPGEAVTRTDLAGAARLEGRGNSILVLLRDDPDLGTEAAQVGAAVAAPEGLDESSKPPGLPGLPGLPEELAGWRDVVTPGLPDKLFVQGEAAMSQSEARALTLCKARLKRGMVVYEIGAGTGSWTVETARLIAPGTVWAVEKSPAAAALVRANLQRFGIDNVKLVEGEAPAVCSGFPPADCVLIGGSGGRLQEILPAARLWLRPSGRVVITAVTPETFSSAWQLLQMDGWAEPETVLVNLARVARRGRAQIWSGENPVFILSARLADGKIEGGPVNA